MYISTLISSTTMLAQAANNGEGHTLLIWGIVLMAVAVALFFVEIFVPTGGIVGTASALALIIGIILLFGYDTIAGLAGSLLALIALPFALSFAIKMWPHTPIGRRLIHRAPTDPIDEELESEGHRQVEERPLARSFDAPELGAVGRSVSELRPVGTCVFEGQRYECLALGRTIDPGTSVRVVAVDGMSIKVKPAD